MQIKFEQYPGVILETAFETYSRSELLGCSSLIIYGLCPLHAEQGGHIFDPEKVLCDEENLDRARINRDGMGAYFAIKDKIALSTLNIWRYYTKKQDRLNAFFSLFREKEWIEKYQFPAVRTRCHGSAYSIVIGSGVCSNENKQPSGSATTYGWGTVAHFFQWLGEQGEFVISSPLLTNPNHYNSEMMSLRRAWMWMPSTGSTIHIKGTGYQVNEDKNPRMLPFETWVKKFPHLKDFDPTTLRG